MPKVPSFLCNQPVFEPETTIAMVEAFLDVCRELNLGSDNHAKEAIAEQILSFAQRGEHDQECLRKMALSAWRTHRDRFPAACGFTPARKLRSKEPDEPCDGQGHRALKGLGSNRRRFDLLGALERRAGETAVDIGA